MSELGPYYPAPDGRLQENQHAWNQVANIIFLDSPAFVGWSYSNTTTDIVVGVRMPLNSRLGHLQQHVVYYCCMRSIQLVIGTALSIICTEQKVLHVLIACACLVMICGADLLYRLRHASCCC